MARPLKSLSDTTQDIPYAILDDFRGESKFSTWLYRITWTTSISKHRAEVRHRSDGLEDNTEKLASASSSFDSIAQDNRKQLIQKALKQLRPEEAVVLTLFYLEEHSQPS